MKADFMLAIVFGFGCVIASMFVFEVILSTVGK